MGSKASTYRTSLHQRQGQLIQLEQSKEQAEAELIKLRNKRALLEKAREVVKLVGLQTQKQVEFHISETVSMALSAVFPEPYEFKACFVERREQTECDLLFVRGGAEIDPISGSGGGAIDVASFALRVACWSLQSPKTRPVLILDEPFKHLKGEEANTRVLDMLKEISTRLGLQIITVSDERVDRTIIEDRADKVFEVSLKKGRSVVK